MNNVNVSICTGVCGCFLIFLKLVEILRVNGRGRYAIVDIEEYEKNQATIKLLSTLMEAEKAIKTGDEWLTEEQVKGELGV